MLAEQQIRLYKDCTTGDLLGLVYISNGNEQAAMIQKEEALSKQYETEKNKVLQWESIGINIPGGYHRCSTEDGFKLQFLHVVAPEDREFFMSHEEALVRDGRIDVTYRIRRKDGTRRWVQDATIRMEQDGEAFYQCTLADITDYVERLNEEKMRLMSGLLICMNMLLGSTKCLHPKWKQEDLSGKRILVVEDNDFNREIAKFLLEKMGIIVVEAENGSVAVDKMLKAKNGDYDMILMDIQMPVMDGYTATQEIRRIANAKIASIPIVAMTANAFKEDTEKCLEVGMNGHLSKPIDAQILMREITKYCL